MTEFPNTSVLEGLRLLFGCVGIAVSLWGYIHASDGQYAFALPIRETEVRDRRSQMLGFLTIHTILGFQAVIVANTPDPPVPSVAGVTGSLTLIFALLLLSIVSAVRISRWSAYEEIVGLQPLSPTDQERLKEASRMGRPMIHSLLQDLQYATAVLEALPDEARLSDSQQDEVDTAAERLSHAGRQLAVLQRMVRGLGLTEDEAEAVPDAPPVDAPPPPTVAPPLVAPTPPEDPPPGGPDAR